VIPRKIDMDELGWKRALKASKSETDGLRLNYNSWALHAPETVEDNCSTMQSNEKGTRLQN
jgi:hypothetical protein